MAKKNNRINEPKIKGYINGAGTTIEQNIDNTLKENYMPYAMSVIMSRALPEIDGFKPSHRKLLYTMYKMGLLKGARTKSANIVGQTMKLNPHGDSAIYDTMVRLSRGNEALLHPYIDSKGNFGKAYSRDMAYAASRYTEAKLDEICNELFGDIDKNTIDFVDNYDNTLKEPSLLPVAFPSILVNANTGIAVSMASSICPFNLKEVCETTIALIKNPNHIISDTLVAPDFPGGGQILYNREQIDAIYNTGRGSIKVRANYKYDKASRCIDILSIPPTTNCEVIIEKIIELSKQNKVKEIADVRDETGLDGMKITIDLKRGVDPDKLMAKLYKATTLEDTFSCNFNVLINSIPKVYSIKELLNEWIKFRVNCIYRRTKFDLDKKDEKLHLLQGLEKILLDIDKAIKIIRQTSEEQEVIPNLMIGFGIDKPQAEYVAEIKLRHLNREYILKRTREIQALKEDIETLKFILSSEKNIKKIIIKELKEIENKYSNPRKSMLIFPDETIKIDETQEVPDYPVTIFFTKEGYFKKITPQSLRMSKEQKLKENDEITQEIETTNSAELLFFTNKHQVYKAKLNSFEDTKASAWGDFIPAKLQMENDEFPTFMVCTKDYKGQLLFFFKNGKLAKVPLSAYATKTNRKKLTNAISDKSELTQGFCIFEDTDFILTSTNFRKLIINSSAVALKTTKNTQGVSVMRFKKGHSLLSVNLYTEGSLPNPQKYRKHNLPSAGAYPEKDEFGEQISF